MHYVGGGESRPVRAKKSWALPCSNWEVVGAVPRAAWLNFVSKPLLGTKANSHPFECPLKVCFSPVPTMLFQPAQHPNATQVPAVLPS